MTLALRYQPTPQYLVVGVSGSASLHDFFAAIDAIAAETVARGATRLLVDLRDVQEEFRFTDHFAIGERASVRLEHMKRVASLVPEARRTGTSEQVASQRGRLLRVFESEAAATAWLSEH